MKSGLTLTAFALLVAFGCFLRFAPGGARRNDLFAALARVRPHERPAEQRLGYYEQLAGALQPGRRPSWEAMPDSYERCFEEAKGGLGPLFVRPEGARAYRYAKNASAVCFDGVAWRTNRFGFRGDDWTDAPAPGVVRIAVTGSSDVAGFGVAAGEAFPARLETLLNANADGVRYEVLNAGVIGYTARDQVGLVDDVLALSPSVLLFVSLGDAEQAVEPCQRIAEAARDRNVRLLWTEIPDIRRGEAPATTSGTGAVEEGVRAAGFRELNVADAFAQYDPMNLWVHEYDAHLGPVAHDLVAHRLAERLTEDRSVLFASSTSPSMRTP